MKRTGILFLFALLLIAGVVEGQSGNSAPSGTYRWGQFYITFSGKDFTGSYMNPISGTFSVSRGRLTLNVKSGAEKGSGIPSKMNWTVVDANTIRDHENMFWKKEDTTGTKGSPNSAGGRDSGREAVLNEQQRQQQTQEQAQKAQVQQQQEEYASIPAEPENSFSFELTSKGDGIKITGYKGSAKEVRIPSSIQDFPVLEISGFARNTTITSVVIPPGITAIGDRLFQGCTNLASVVIPNSVTSIGTEAFKDCVNLASVNRFPDRIGDSAFQGCRSLTGTINLDGNVGNNAFAGTGFSAVTLSLRIYGRNISASVFADCLNLREATIVGRDLGGTTRGEGREQVTINQVLVPEGLFRGCTALTTVNLSRVTGISARAFSGCTSLTDIAIPASVTGGRQGEEYEYVSIGDGAFAGCSSLTTITIPESVTRIDSGRDAFSGCSGLSLRAQARLKQLGYSGSF